MLLSQNKNDVLDKHSGSITKKVGDLDRFLRQNQHDSQCRNEEEGAIKDNIKILIEVLMESLVAKMVSTEEGIDF